MPTLDKKENSLKSSYSTMTRDEKILCLWSYVYFVAVSICRSWGINDQFLVEDCQSVATEAMIKAVDSYANGSSLKTWVSLNSGWAVKNYLQSLFNRDCHGSPLPTEWVQGPEDCICNFDLIRRFLSVVERKDDAYGRQVFENYFLEGFTMTEIAALRNCTVANISFKISRIKSDIFKSPFFSEYSNLEDIRK